MATFEVEGGDANDPGGSEGTNGNDSSSIVANGGLENGGTTEKDNFESAESYWSSSSDEEGDRLWEGDEGGVPPPSHKTDAFPSAVLEMEPDLRRLLKVQLRGFREHMNRAVERNFVEDLEALTELYNRQIFAPFLNGAPFEEIKHPEKVPDPDDMEDDPLPLPTFLDKYMVTGRLAKWIVNSKIFETVILVSIIVAGILVGAETYFECGDTLSCRSTSRYVCPLVDGACPEECCSDQKYKQGTMGGSGVASVFIAGSGSAQLADPNGWEDKLDSGLDSIASFNASDISAPDLGLSDNNVTDGSWRVPDGGDFDDFNNGLTGLMGLRVVDSDSAKNYQQDANVTITCWKKGPMPECATGDIADAAMITIYSLDRIVLLIFTAECILRILEQQLSPWKYFYSVWNCFDFIIVGACWIPGAEGFAVLRLLRLARLFKLLRMVENLQVILRGLGNGLSAITYIMILLLLVFYLFAIASIMMFRDNDPVHFASLQLAMVSLFRMSTMEDWTDIMYVNMWGCLQYGYAGGSYCHDEAHCSMDQLCNADSGLSHGYGMPTAIFFIVFIVVAGLVIMSLFVGVITTSMVEAAQASKTERREAKLADRKKRVKAHVAELDEAEAEAGAHVSASQAAMENLAEPKRMNPVLQAYATLGLKMKALSDSHHFHNFITVAILVTALIIGLQTYSELEEKYNAEFAIADEVILSIFILEFFIKLLACGLRPYRYFFDGWNVFDFLVLAACFMPFGGSMASALRLFRLLRVLKLFNNITELQIIMAGLAKGMSSVAYIGILMFLQFYVFGIIALYYFRTNDPVHFPNLQMTMVTLFRCATMEDWTDVMYISMYGCNKYYYGNDNELHKCENDESYGMVAAIYWIVFIMLSSFVMLNLVVGVVCSSMTEARTNHDLRKKKEARIATISRTSGVEMQIIDAWCKGFFELDDSEGWADGNIDRSDLDLVLRLLGEETLVSQHSREKMLIRANHTFPQGMISMTDFVDALAHDLKEQRYMKTRRYGRLHQQKRLLEECDDDIERKTLQRKVDIAERKLQKLLADESEAHKVFDGKERAGGSASSSDDDGDDGSGGGGSGGKGSVDDDGEHNRMDNPLAAGFVGGAADDDDPDNGDPDNGDET